jgi:hypothetical protein
MKITAFWDVASCNLIQDEGVRFGKFLCNVDTYLTGFTSSYLVRSQSSISTLPWTSTRRCK